MASLPIVTSMVLSGLYTRKVSPVSVILCFPVAASHNRTSPELSVVSVEPSGLYTTRQTEPVWPVSVAFWCPVETSHKRTVLSSLPVASVEPSGLYATLLTARLCPVSRASSLPVYPSNIQIPMEVAKARCAPSGEYVSQYGLPLPKRALAPLGKPHRVFASYSAELCGK